MTLFLKFLTLLRFCVFKAPVNFGIFLIMDLLNKLFPMLVFLVLIRGMGEIVALDGKEVSSQSINSQTILAGIAVLILLQPIVKIVSEISNKHLIAVLLEQRLKGVLEKRYLGMSTTDRLRPFKVPSNLIADTERLLAATVNIAPTATLIGICIIALTIFLSPFFVISVVAAIVLGLFARLLTNGKRQSSDFRRVDALRKKRWIERLQKKIAKKTKNTFANAAEVEGYYFNPRMKAYWHADVIINNIPFISAALALLLLISHFAMFIQTTSHEDIVNLLSFVVIIRFFVNFLRFGNIQFIRLSEELARCKV